jgi:hypothetical protein
MVWFSSYHIIFKVFKTLLVWFSSYHIIFKVFKTLLQSNVFICYKFLEHEH